MLLFNSNGGYLIEHGDPLPELSGKELFLDIETTSFDSSTKALNPWHKCWPLGIAVKSDDGPAYYVAIHHDDKRANFDATRVQAWLKHVFANHEVWINHNIKFDAQVLFAKMRLDPKIKKYCTLDLSMLIDSDRFRHGLDALSKDWLHEDISRFEGIFAPYLEKNYDYGLIPTDLMAEYACQDVVTNARLWKYIQHKMPPESQAVMETSSKCLETLMRIERNGMRVDVQDVTRQEIVALNRMTVIQSQIATEVGYTVQPNSPKDCYDFLCNCLGFPVLARNDPTPGNPMGNPKFDADVLEQYKSLPGAPIEIIDKMLEYRRLGMFVSMFCDAYRNLNVDGLLHPSYRQTVRTGRMSCSTPNMQQLMSEAKMLIIPGEDECIISADYSQIEFRVIVHYIQNAAAIAAYAEDPFTDFHMWVKEMCEVERDTAKTLNFMMGYGGGQKKLVKALSRQKSLVEPIMAELANMDLSEESLKKRFHIRAEQRGNEVYNTYHRTLRELKPTSRAAEQRVYERGYVTNKYGRRRTLPMQAAWRAFNTVCQGTAADLMKDRLVALDEWLQANVPDLLLIGVVHDEVVLRGPARYAQDERLLDTICYILEDVNIGLRVPIRTSIGTSTVNWYEAAECAKNRHFDRAALAALV